MEKFEKKYTPGPWEASQSGYDWKFEGGYNGRIKSVNGDTVFAGPSSFKAIRGETEAQAIANANLIAAAPELLEALEWCLSPGNHLTPLVESEVRAAIAKAYGKEVKDV